MHQSLGKSIFKKLKISAVLQILLICWTQPSLDIHSVSWLMGSKEISKAIVWWMRATATAVISDLGESGQKAM